MSKHSAERFVLDMRQSAQMLEQFSRLSDPAARARAARDLGYDFTPEELAAARREAGLDAIGEIPFAARSERVG